MFESVDFHELVELYALPWLINIGLAVLILVLGRMLVAIAVRIAKALLGRANVDPMLINFVGSILTGLLVLVVFIAAIDQLGVDTTSLVALIGAAGLAIGLALQKSLSNFAAGVMLVLFKPFKVGDYVEAAGTAGVVREIRIFSTTMNTPDNKMVTVPNGSIYENTITNYSALDTRRIDLVFGIGYQDDIRLAKEIIQRILADDERVLPEPEPFVHLGDLADSSVNLIARPWVKREDWLMARCDITEKVKLTFDANGISIPFPQRDLHIYREPQE